MRTTSPSGEWQSIIIRAMNSLAAAYGSPDDAGRILEYMAALVPNRPEIVAAQVRILLLQKNYSEARSMLLKAESANPANAVIKAMAAICLYIQADPLWESYVAEALALPPTVMTTALLDSLAKSSGKQFGRAGAQTSAPGTPVDYHSYGLAC